jgi:hypothetical protein
MPTVAHDLKADLATLRRLWKEVRSDLARAKRAIDDEIRGYPTPIPRCDAQFNHLHEQRGRLARELDRIAALSEKNFGVQDYVRLIEEFIASAPYTDDGSERELRSRLGAELPNRGLPARITSL